MPIRPDRKELHAQDLRDADARQAAQDLAGAAEACRRAADRFAGSRDPEELDLRHQALARIGATWRRTGHFGEAEAAYEQFSRTAAAEAGEGSRAHLLGRYFVGLTRADRDDHAGAAAAMREAHEGFSRLPSTGGEVRTIGAALGLELLRDHQWTPAVEVLRRLVAADASMKREDETSASLLHNLALALIHRGDGASARWFARVALEQRARLNGTEHPLYVETRLVEARAMVDAGESNEAAPIIREAAAAVLAGGGEAHQFFSRALLAEARRVAKAGDGDGGAAEALARRALWVLRQREAPRGVIAEAEWEAAGIPLLWRGIAGASGPEDVRLWRVDLQHTLRRYQVHSLDFIGSGDQPLCWYFFVPARADLRKPEDAMRWAQVVFADASAVLTAREPADANFLDATAAVGTEPSPAELAGTDFIHLYRQRTWEDSCVYTIVEGRQSRPLAPTAFARALCAYLALRGGQPNPRPWIDVGVDAAVLQRAAANPGETLRAVLWLA